MRLKESGHIWQPWKFTCVINRSAESNASMSSSTVPVFLVTLETFCVSHQIELLRWKIYSRIYLVLTTATQSPYINTYKAFGYNLKLESIIGYGILEYVGLLRATHDHCANNFVQQLVLSFAGMSTAHWKILTSNCNFSVIFLILCLLIIQSVLFQDGANRLVDTSRTTHS